MTRTDQQDLRQALKLIRRLEADLDAHARRASEPIAIVGIACRLPGADGLDAFWSLLEAGRDAITMVPPERWDADALYAADPDAPGRLVTRHGGFIDGVDCFDAAFFGITPREAALMDPQQRLLLELAWAAFEDAAIPPDTLDGRAGGVFIGICASDYGRLALADPAGANAYWGTGNAPSVAAGRLAYTFGLTGPCMSIDTACSSALVAVHQAVESLRRGECGFALVGSANLLLAPEATIAFSKARMMSPDGRCHSFDARANGYVRAEGAAMLVLKPLARARADGDRIHAVIRGSAINQDGASGGLTVPNGPAQAALIRRALANAGLAPREIAYVETHGTGTALGDPIELGALGEVFGADRAGAPPLYLGAVKSLIGHLEVAAGIAGLIKLVLALGRGVIPGYPHLGELNPHVPWDRLPFAIARAATPWPDARRIGGVSSFGFSGTNAHVVVEAPPAPEPEPGEAAPPPAAPPLHLLCVSARSDAALRVLAARYAARVRDGGDDELDALCHAAATGRAHLRHRLAVVAPDAAGLAAQLDAQAARTAAPDAAAFATPRIAFLFTGQGAQYPGMGEGLYRRHPAFRAAFDACEAAFAGELDRPLRDVMWGADTALLAQTRYTQPALFALEYALARLWLQWGATPVAVAGHSIGEFAAACIAGVLGLDDAARLVAARGRLMQALPAGGAMVAVAGASRAQVEAALAGLAEPVAIAAYNAPTQLVLSGASGPLQEACARLAARHAVVTTPLDVSHAFHSPLMRPMLDAFGQAAARVRWAPPSLEFVSTVTGAGAADAVGDPAYWVAQVGAPVDFHAALERLAADGVNLLIEIGPGATLTALARDTLAGRPVRAVSSLRRRGDDWTTLVGALGELYAAGATFDWREAGRIAPAARRACALPAYPFERRRHWLPAATASAARAGSETDAGPDEAHAHPLLGARLPTAALADGECLYQASPDPREVRDHRVYERIVMPGAAYVDLALRVASTLYPETPPALDALSISQALVFPPARRTVLQTLATRRGDGGHDLRVFSRRADEPGAGWRAHAGARLGAPCAPVANPDLGALRASFDASGETLPVDAFYADYAALGLAYGPGYRCVRALSRRADARAVLARIAADVAPDPGYLLAPPLLDGCFQAVGAIVGAPGGETAYLPVSIERVWAPRATPAAFWCHATLRAPRDDAPARVVADLRLIADDGGLIAAIDGLEAVPVERRALQFATADWRDLLYEVNWQTRPARAAELPPVAAHGGWLVLGDAAAAAAAAQFEARGAQVVRVGAAEAEGMTCGDWRQLFALRFDAAGVPFAGVVHLSAADAAEAGAPAALADPALGAGALLLAQALAERATAAGPRLWFVTRGAQRVDEQGPTHPAHALLWGFARSVALECPALACACVDLPPGETGLPPGFADDLLAPDAEPSSAYRQGRRSVARLGPLKASPFRPGLARPAGPFRLRALRYGGLDALALLGCARPAPGPGEVEIEVQAGAVNFKDVLFSLGMLQAFSEGRGIRRALDQPLGFECAGRIARLGAGVTGFAPGDVVFAMAPSALAAYVNADARLVRPVPRGLTPAEAAALPTVFMTAIHALERLARVRPGERVLVHACAGGVGQAALQIARRAGATVYGTASPSKWAALKAQGVAHVMHSRTLDFADELRRVTDGRGVDVVLNSLGGAFIPRSADVLAPGGRFVEIGKIDIWDAARMQAYRPDIAYAAFDLGELDDTAGGLQADLLDAVAHGFEAGELRPLPVRTFPIAQAEAAFRHLAQARQVGKVVLDLAAAPDTARPVRADRRYLVTGGFGALGRRLVARLADEGARDLVVAGRRADPAALDAWRTRYPAVRFEALEMDVTDAASVAAGFRRIDADGPPLGGVVHAAGALDDATLANLDWARFARVLAPKLAGAWHLHEATAARALDWFVLFSSIASVTGAPGQANYAAANACVDALARYRHAQGLPATCIGWGPWDDAGMAERARDANRARFDALGVARLPAGDALDVFAFLLGADTHAVVADVAWPRFLGSLPTTGDAPFYALLGRRAASAAAREDGALAKQLRAAPADARAGLVATALRALLADVTGGAAELIDLGQPLRELGIDSLMVVELNHRLEARLGCKLGPKLLVEQPTLEGLAARLAGLALGEGGRGEAGAVAGHDAADGQGARAAGQPADAQDAPGARDLPGEHDPTAGRDRAEARGARLPAAPREPAPAPLASMSDTRLDLDGRRIGLCRWGSAVAPMQIVCVHGILDQGAIWAPFAQALAATGVGVVAPDLRGHGPLGAPPGAPPPSMAEFVADLLAVLDHVAGAGRRVVLAGHSLGSIAAALGAALRPGAIAHLVLVEPVAPSLREAADPVERLAQDLRYLTDAPAHPVYPDLASAARMLLLRHPALDASLAEALARRIARDVAGGVSWRWDARLRNPLGVDPQCSQADYLAVLGRLAMPSTRFYGRASEFAGTPVLVAPDLALPRGASVTLDGGHNLHTDAAARLADAVSALCHDLERG